MRAAMLLVLLLAAACGGQPSPATPSPSSPTPGRAVVAAVGDISCGAGSGGDCRDAETAALVSALAPDAFLALGDLQYERGSLPDFQNHYDRDWGRFRGITHPVVGNHEYMTRDASGYFDYWNGPGRTTGPAGERGRGYYAFDLGSWRAIALNSNCGEVGGCGPGSAQERWLRDELRANPRPCTLGYFHHPRFSSGPHGNEAEVAPLWEALMGGGAELILTGHDHLYERFAPQDAGGRRDDARGIREFVVGTGGKEHYDVVDRKPNSEARLEEFGILELGLTSSGYDWRFMAVGGAVRDSGTGTCR